MHCYACYNLLSNTQQQCIAYTQSRHRENRDIGLTDITEITHMLGLKVISLEIHSDLNSV